MMSCDCSGIRLGALRQQMKESGADCFFSVHAPDSRYFCGFMGDTSGLVVTESDAFFLCDARFTEQAHAEVAAFEVREVRGNFMRRLGELLTELDPGVAAYDPAHLTVAQQMDVQHAYQGELIPAAALASSLRLTKISEEIAAIRKASNIAEAALEATLAGLHAGITELELAARLEYEFKTRGASGPSFDTIVLFGSRASLPHGQPTDTPLQSGDTVLIDLGCRYAGYCSDLTRTYAYDTMPDRWFEEIYGIVLDAQQAALNAVHPGVRCSDLDAMARTVIADAGYGAHFGHGLGHGVGLEIHEAPRINSESDTLLAEGMVITIEPGIYLPGRGGVRIEDLVVVTNDGCDILTRSSKQLKVLHQ